MCSDKVSYNKNIAFVITLELTSGFNANKINYLLLLVSCGIISLSCGTSLLNELHDYNKHVDLFHSGPYSYTWSYRIGWASVAVTLIGSIISSIDIYLSPKDAENPVMSFKT